MPWKEWQLKIFFIPLSRKRTLAFHMESYTGLPCNIFVFIFISCFRPTVKRCEVEIAYSRKQAFKKKMLTIVLKMLWFCGHTTCVVFECSPDHIFQNGSIYTREGSFTRRIIHGSSSVKINYWKSSSKRMTRQTNYQTNYCFFVSKFLPYRWSVSNINQAIKNDLVVYLANILYFTWRFPIPCPAI